MLRSDATTQCITLTLLAYTKRDTVASLLTQILGILAPIYMRPQGTVIKTALSNYTEEMGRVYFQESAFSAISHSSVMFVINSVVETKYTCKLKTTSLIS